MGAPEGQGKGGRGFAGWLADRYLKLVTAAVFLTIGVLYLQNTFLIRVPRIGDPLGPRAFPLGLAYAFMGLTLVFLLGTLSGRSTHSDSRDLRAQGRAWAAFGMLAVFVVILPHVGYPVAVALFAVAFLTFLGFASVLANLAIGVVIATVFQIVFVAWLRLPMPTSW